MTVIVYKLQLFIFLNKNKSVIPKIKQLSECERILIVLGFRALTRPINQVQIDKARKQPKIKRAHINSSVRNLVKISFSYQIPCLLHPPSLKVYLCIFYYLENAKNHRD